VRYRSTYSYSESFLRRKLARAERRAVKLAHERAIYQRRIAIRNAFAADQRAEDDARGRA